MHFGLFSIICWGFGGGIEGVEEGVCFRGERSVSGDAA